MPHRRQPQPGTERRRAPRHPAARLPKLHVSILAGPDVTVVDVSPHGLLVQSDVRLIPGAEICLTIKFPDQSYMVGGRVARVETAMSEGKLTYQAGIALEGPFAPFDLPAQEPAAPDALPAAPAAKRGSEPKRASHSAAASGQPSETSVDALRHTLDEQRKQSEQGVRMVEMLKAALRMSEKSRKDAEAEHRQELEKWQHERRTLEQTIEIAARHRKKLSAELTAQASSGQAARGDMEAARAAAQAERDRLIEQLGTANIRLEETASEVETLRQKSGRLERTLDEERAMLAGLLEEKDALLAQLETLRPAVDALTRERDESHEERLRGQVEQKRLAQQLEAAERWCADQNALIYELWQQAQRSTSLIEGWRSAKRHADTAAENKPASPGRERHEGTARTPKPAGRSTRPAQSIPISPSSADE